ncbi:MAG: cell division protein FtsZ [Verrucomicrobia bacterium]|nr:cell division protein FtsZ [Verrucomicrobiota bacterium]
MTTPRKPATAKNDADAAPRRFRLKLIGVGGAGGNCIHQIAATTGALDGVELLAVNTDLQALDAVEGADKLQIGATVTRGLGTGGDPDVGAAAAQQDAEQLEAALRHADVVFLTAGLGGGTGTGASPILAKLAKEQGALVLAFVALPFAFEGARRRHQADAGLEQLKAQADAVICIPNDRLTRIIGENAPVTEAFKRGNEIVASGVRAVWQLLSRKGLINLDFADLRATLGGKHGEGVFSHAEASGPDRLRDAMKCLMDNPLFDGSDTLARADGILVSILGGPDLTLADVQRATEPISRVAQRAHVIMGAAIDEDYVNRLGITIIAAQSVVAKRTAPGVAIRAPARPQSPPVASPKPASSGEPGKPVQETLPLEGVTRGTFTAGEPTIYNGEDLDYPTFLRRGVSLKR